jgi:hypothetical protein
LIDDWCYFVDLDRLRRMLANQIIKTNYIP